MSKKADNLRKERSGKAPLIVERVTEGYCLNEKAIPQSESPFSIIVLTIFGYFVVSFFVFLLPFGLIFFIIALFRQSFRQHICAYFLLSPSDLVFAHYPLRLGDNVRVTFRRRLKRNRKLPQNNSVIVKLLCVERVSYTQGTDTIVETALLDEKSLRSRPVFSRENELSYHFDLDIPTHLPASFEANKNQIRWIIVAEQTIPGIVKNFDSTFTFWVET